MIRIYEYMGMKFEVPEGEEWIVKTCVDRIMAHEGSLDVVIDVGAHVGSLTVAAARRGATVFCLEPSLENFQRTLRNIDLNHVGKRIYPMRLAIGPGLGFDATLKRIGSNTGQRGLAFSEGVEHETCCTISLDQLIEITGGADYLKIDIEGYEYWLFDQERNREALQHVAYLDMDVHRIDFPVFDDTHPPRDFDMKTPAHQPQMRDLMKSYGFPDSELEHIGSYNTDLCL
jgi:FkbM family methyltransferase